MFKEMEIRMKDRYYALSGYGMFLCEAEAISAANAFCKSLAENSDDYNDYENLYKFSCESGATQVSEDDGFEGRSIYPLNMDGTPDDGNPLDNPDGLMFFSEKQGTILSGYVGATYQTLEEMANDLRKRYKKYLPDDFNYRKHLCFFAGARFA